MRLPRQPTEPKLSVVRAVCAVHSGDALLAPGITRRLVQRGSDTATIRRGLASLTPRELEVLGVLARGLSNAELAAARLHLAEAAVRSHVARILAKPGLRNESKPSSPRRRRGWSASASARPPGGPRSRRRPGPGWPLHATC